MKTKLEGEVLQLEAEMNHLWGELNTANIAHTLRVALEKKLGGLEEQFKAVMEGRASYKDFEAQLREIDYTLALGAITHTQQDIPKSGHLSRTYQALENVKKDLEGKKITPNAARHEVKTILWG